MIAFLMPFLRGLLRPRVLIALAGVVVAAGIWWRWNDMKRTITQQVSTIEELQAGIAVRDRQLEMRDLAAAELEARLSEQEETTRELQTILQEVTSAGADQDGPVAPVLSRALERLRDHQQGGSGDP